MMNETRRRLFMAAVLAVVSLSCAKASPSREPAATNGTPVSTDAATLTRDALDAGLVTADKRDASDTTDASSEMRSAPAAYRADAAMIWGLSSNGTVVVWQERSEIDDGGLRLMAAVDGESPERLATIAQGSSENSAADATNAYFFVDRGGRRPRIVRVPLKGGRVTEVVSDVLLCGGLTSDGARLYFMDFPARHDNQDDIECVLRSVSVRGGPVTDVLRPRLSVRRLLAKDGAVYVLGMYNGRSSVLKVPSRGVTATTIVSEPSIEDMAVDTTSIYWTLGATREGSFDNGAIVTQPLAGGIPRTLASRQHSPTAIAVSTDSVYWTSGDQEPSDSKSWTLMSVPRGGGSVQMFAEVHTKYGSTLGLGLSGESVYWTVGGPQLYRVTP